MKYKLIKPINSKYSAIEQVLTNRGVEYNNIQHYINTTDQDINSFLLLDEFRLMTAACVLLGAIKDYKSCLVIVD